MVKSHITVFDTTLRDGEQSPGCSMNLSEKLRMAHRLDELGVDVIEAGFPIASEGDFAAVKERPRPTFSAPRRHWRGRRVPEFMFFWRRQIFTSSTSFVSHANNVWHKRLRQLASPKASATMSNFLPKMPREAIPSFYTSCSPRLSKLEPPR